MRSERRRSIDHRPISVFGVARWILFATVLFLGANYSLNAYLMTIDKAPVRAHLKEAFAKGDLGIINSRVGDSDMGVHQTNDCLIFDMAARDSDGNLLYLFAGARTGAAREDKPGNCELLRDWLEQDPTQRFWEVWYLRYIHGYRSVAILLLEKLSVVETRDLLKDASYGALGLALLVNLVFAAAQRSTLRAKASSSFVGYALIAASLIGFFGLPYFGQSISHAPAIVALAAFLFVWSCLDRFGLLSERSGLLAIIGFGLFTAYFEYLTGYIPVGTCVIMALVAIAWGSRTTASPWSLIRYLVLAEASFAGTIFAAFALHTLATATVSRAGLDTVTLFIDRLSSRMAQTAPGDVSGVQQVRTLSLLDVGAALVKQFAHLGPWSQRTTATIILASLGMSAIVAYDSLFMKGRAVARLSAALAAGSLLPVFVWILAFQNHTTIHAAFMVRILAVVPMAGVLGVWAWWRVRAESAAAVRTATRLIAPIPLTSGQPA